MSKLNIQGIGSKEYDYDTTEITLSFRYRGKNSAESVKHVKEQCEEFLAEFVVMLGCNDQLPVPGMGKGHCQFPVDLSPFHEQYPVGMITYLHYIPAAFCRSVLHIMSLIHYHHGYTKSFFHIH